MPDSPFIGTQKYLVIICKNTDDHNNCITLIWSKIELKAKKIIGLLPPFAHSKPHECRWSWCSASAPAPWTDGSITGDTWLLGQASQWSMLTEVICWVCLGLPLSQGLLSASGFGWGLSWPVAPVLKWGILRKPFWASTCINTAMWKCRHIVSIY